MAKTVPVVFPAIPTKAAEIDSKYMVDYCLANKQIDFLKAEVNKTMVCKDGSERPNSIFNVRSAFIDKFMPEIKTVAKPKKPTLKDLLKDL
jgi:hypothetical protein